MRTSIAVALVVGLLGAHGINLAQTPADRERANIQNRLGWEHMRAEHWPEAIKAFSQATDIDPQFEYAFYGLGRAHLASKQYVYAIAALDKCRALYVAQAGKQFSNAQDRQRYRRDRVMEIDEQIRLQQTGPQNRQSQEILRQLQDRRRDVQESIQMGNNLTIDSSVPPWVSLSLGSAYFRAGKLADAEREYKATIAVDPKAGEAHNNLAVVFLETGRYTEAEASLSAAKKAGFRVHPDLEREIRDKKKGG